MLWYQYKALMYKNWLIWRRRLGGSLCELLFPILIFVLLAGLKNLVGSSEEDSESYLSHARYVRPTSESPVTFDFKEGHHFKFCEDYIDEGEDWAIGLSPDNEITRYLESAFLGNPALSGVSILYFADNGKVDDYVEDEDYEDGPKLCFAVVFDEIKGNRYEYQIRFNQTYSLTNGGAPMGNFIDIFDFESYEMTDESIAKPMEEFQEQFIESGFVQIQNYVDNYILQKLVGNSAAYIAGGFVPMKFDEYLDDPFLGSVGGLLPFFIVLCYLMPVCRMISQIVEEKEYKLKEMMMIMGLSNRIYWMSWVTHYFIIFTLIGLASLIMTTQVYTFSNVFYLFLVFFLFGLSCISYGLLVSVFFSSSKLAITIGLMVFLGLFFAYFWANDPRLDSQPKILVSLIPSVALGLGLVTISELEISELGLHPSTLSTEVDGYMVLFTILFLVLDSIILLLLAIYLDAVLPQEWGTNLPWNFLCKKTYWNAKSSLPEFNDETEYNEDIEEVDPSVEVQKRTGEALLIRGLTKQFAKGTRAVDELDLDIYQGEIFALLGHNGAGKTTTISMITGLIRATSGDVKYNDCYLSRDLKELRKYFGVCPQQNVLWKELTVTEHLYIFARFKGLSDRKEISEKITVKLDEVALIPQRNKRSDQLSGGQKRKLSLAVALIGDPKIVLLDEPTSGMDLTARRLMWDMLKTMKSNRIIILTTHYMQEADVLADRICILSSGKLRCCGSSLFLKNKYGVGYHLTLVKQSDVSSPEHSARVEEFVLNLVPNTTKSSDVHAEIAFQLPLESSGLFRDLFDQLDASLEELQLRSYSVSATTLEEVFIRVARGDNKLLLSKMGEEPVEAEKLQLEGLEGEEGTRLVESERETEGLFNRHFLALLRKRLIISLRDLKTLAFEVLIPLALVLMGLAFIYLSGGYSNLDSIQLEVDEYETPQELLYPESTGYLEDLMSYIDSLSDTKSLAVATNSLDEFDEEVFKLRDQDIYRMGSYYFYEMDENNHIYEPLIFHNQTAFQSLAVFYQFMSLSILQQIDPTVEILVSNHPLRITQKVLDTTGASDGILACLIFGLGFSFIPAAVIAYIVIEREHNVKHQHLISGVSLWAYWLVNFLWDISIHICSAIIAALLVLAFGSYALTDPISKFWGLLVLFVLFGFAATPFVYAVSFYFKNYSTAQSTTIMFFFVSGSILPLFMYICSIFTATREYVKISRWFFMLLPSFCLGNGIIYIGSSRFLADLDDKSEEYNAFDIEGAGIDMVMLVADTALYLLMLFLLEYWESTPSIRRITTYSEDPVPFTGDSDVEEEKEKALNTDPSSVQINVRSLKKVFKSYTRQERTVAVEDVSFNVHKMECFALLGVNGAGKTTTFKMLTGEYTASSGEAYLAGYDVAKQLNLARDNIGYCPQFDALSALMTCKEHLEFYSEIKGINKTKIPVLVDDLLYDLDLVKYRNYKAGVLSGGNKRKLSVAISLIGNPTVVFLDEPSAGMDPETRRKLWQVLGDIKKRDSAVVLTTHSMEEAEALCDRMAIMVSGRLRCLGSPTHLRNRFGQGYELEIKIKMPKERAILEQNERLRGVLGERVDVYENEIVECLEALDAGYLFEEITPKGAGSSVHYQLETDGRIPSEGLVSWVIIEKRGRGVLELLRRDFEDAHLVEHYLALFKFRIGKQEDRSIGFLFSMMDYNKQMYKISEYALSQTSLDQIFAMFAMEGEKELEGNK